MSKPILEPVNLCTCLYYGRGLTQTRVTPAGRSCPAHPTEPYAVTKKKP